MNERSEKHTTRYHLSCSITRSDFFFFREKLRDTLNIVERLVTRRAKKIDFLRFESETSNNFAAVRYTKSGSDLLTLLRIF